MDLEVPGASSRRRCRSVEASSARSPTARARLAPRRTRPRRRGGDQSEVSDQYGTIRSKAPRRAAGVGRRERPESSEPSFAFEESDPGSAVPARREARKQLARVGPGRAPGRAGLELAPPPPRSGSPPTTCRPAPRCRSGTRSPRPAGVGVPPLAGSSARRAPRDDVGVDAEQVASEAVQDQRAHPSGRRQSEVPRPCWPSGSSPPRAGPRAGTARAAVLPRPRRRRRPARRARIRAVDEVADSGRSGARSGSAGAAPLSLAPQAARQ